MKEDNIKIWNELKQVPASAKKKISGGRLKGLTDIKPQWRLQMMTEQFGAIGIGWYYDIVNTWKESYGTEISVYVQLNLFIKDGDKWSAPIVGLGGSMLVANEKIYDNEKPLYDTSFKPYHSDECYKMALTDALSVAMKQLGVAADVYMGLSDSKYDKPVENNTPTATPATNLQRSTLKDYMAMFKEKEDYKGHDYIHGILADKNLSSENADTVIRKAKIKVEL
ncbi:MAG: hypothetical protein JRJ00_00380 [Deltaproteobacteria bacterium]|nr:hypothetical protein [Deltaproteobacteria bacterium]